MTLTYTWQNCDVGKLSEDIKILIENIRKGKGIGIGDILRLIVNFRGLGWTCMTAIRLIDDYVTHKHLLQTDKWQYYSALWQSIIWRKNLQLNWQALIRFNTIDTVLPNSVLAVWQWQSKVVQIRVHNQTLNLILTRMLTYH